MRFATCLLAVLVSAWAVADDAKSPAADPIQADLTKACDEYQVIADTAKDKLLLAMDELKEKTEGNNGLKVDLKIKLVEQIDAERQRFVDNSLKPPTVDKLRNAVREYKGKVQSASEKCLDAFDTAAEKYGKARELDKAKEVLEEKSRFAKGDRADEFIAKTIWSGEATLMIAGRERRSDVHLWITEREPGRFKGRFQSDECDFEVTGVVSVRGIRWSTADTKATKGESGFGCTGRMRGMYLSLMPAGADEGVLGRSGKVMMTRREIQEPK